MPSVVRVAWVDGGRDRGFGRCCDGEMASIRLVVVATARERKENSGRGIEVRILVNGTEYLADVLVHRYLSICKLKKLGWLGCPP